MRPLALVSVFTEASGGVIGNDRIVQVNGVELCVETIGEPGDPAILLISGAGASMDWWEDDFCARLAAGCRFIIRFGTSSSRRSSCTHPEALLVIAAIHPDDEEPIDAPPWPLTRAEVQAFATDALTKVRIALTKVRIERASDPRRQTDHRWRAEFHRPADDF